MLTVLASSLIPGINAQSIFTIAGGADLDGRPATAFPLTRVIDVAIDRSGNIYLSDGDAFRVRKVAGETGLISTVAGNGVTGSGGDGAPATAAAIVPTGLAVDLNGNLYVIDDQAFGGSVRRVDATTGVITTVAGGGGSIDDGVPATEYALHVPSGITLDTGGNLFIAANDGVHRVDAATGRIHLFAGGGFDGLGDGGPATRAVVSPAADVAIDESERALYIADNGSGRIRRVDFATGIISTVAGGGDFGSFPDGGPATKAYLPTVDGVAVDPAGNIAVVSWLMNEVYEIDTQTGTIDRVAGAGLEGYSGDGGPATNAKLSRPEGVEFDRDGLLYIADTENGRIRKVDPTGTITTVAGAGRDRGFQFVGDGGPGTAATLFSGDQFTFGALALDVQGNLYITDAGNYRIRKLDTNTGIITTVAGTGGKGEWNTPPTGVPATESALSRPSGVAVDREGNIYFSDVDHVLEVDVVTGILSEVGTGETEIGWTAGDVAVDREGSVFVSAAWGYYVWRIDRHTGMTEVYAGNGESGYSGDGGPATMAGLFQPHGLALDSNDNLYIAASDQHRIRKVDRETGIITTVAGGGECGWPCDGNDGKPATETELSGEVVGVAVDPQGNIFIAESGGSRGGSRIHRVDAATGLLWRIAGLRETYPFMPLYSGDNGPAAGAGLAVPEGLAASPEGDVYILDTFSNRVRVIYACRAIAKPVLISPADGSSGIPAAPRIEWSPIAGAFRYDLYLDDANPPVTRAGVDLESTSFSPANLDPFTTYYWKIVAKGDPFCEPFRTAESEIWSFTTAIRCDKPEEFDGGGPS